jgi:hypothetical protein
LAGDNIEIHGRPREQVKKEGKGLTQVRELKIQRKNGGSALHKGYKFRPKIVAANELLTRTQHSSRLAWMIIYCTSLWIISEMDVGVTSGT